MASIHRMSKYIQTGPCAVFPIRCSTCHTNYVNSGFICPFINLSWLTLMPKSLYKRGWTYCPKCAVNRKPVDTILDKKKKLRCRYCHTQVRAHTHS